MIDYKHYNRVDSKSFKKKGLQGEAYITITRPYRKDGDWSYQYIHLRGFSYSSEFYKLMNGKYDESENARNAAIEYAEERKEELIKLGNEVIVNNETWYSQSTHHIIRERNVFDTPISEEEIGKILREHNINMILQ